MGEKWTMTKQNMTKQSMYHDLASFYGNKAVLWAAVAHGSHDSHMYAVSAAHFGRLALQHSVCFGKPERRKATDTDAEFYEQQGPY